MRIIFGYPEVARKWRILFFAMLLHSKKPLSPAKRHPLHPSCAGVVQLWKQTMVFINRHDGAAEYGQNTDGPQPHRLRRHMNTLSVLRLQLLVSMISPLNMMDLLYQ